MIESNNEAEIRMKDVIPRALNPNLSAVHNIDIVNQTSTSPSEVNFCDYSAFEAALNTYLVVKCRPLQEKLVELGRLHDR